MTTRADRPRVVFDCNIYLQAAVSNTGPAFACLEMAEQGHFTLLLSAAILIEARGILARPSVRKQFPSLTPATVNKFFLRLTQVAEYVSAVPAAIQFDRDPKDEPYLNLASAASASYLVTRDKDMLDFTTDKSKDGQRLRDALPNLQVLDPVAFLQEIGTGTNDEENLLE